MITNQYEIEYTKEELQFYLKEFYDLYLTRPIKDNQGGMKSPHLFNTWLAIKKLQPKLIIESGVWKGLGTWILEKAAPEATIISIDITWKHLQYKSKDVLYIQKDITSIDWETTLKEQFPSVKKEEVVVFLDDHQNFLERIEFLNSTGFKHILYEDNYPLQQGDTHSPKKILSMRDYIMDYAGRRTLHRPSFYDYDRLSSILDTYQEMPPIFKIEMTRWGDVWDNENYPTREPLLSQSERNKFPLYFEEADSYTWICYIKLK